MVVRVCIDANHLPFVTSLAFPQGIAPGENIELYIGTWDLPENPPPKANTIVVDPLTKVVHVARYLENSGNGKRKCESPLEGNRKKLAQNAANIALNLSGPSGASSKHKCGECGERFGSMREISVHMQQHLKVKTPQDKNSTVTLSYRPKDGSPMMKATITHNPTNRNIAEISIPLIAPENFRKAGVEQAQKILTKHVQPTGDNQIRFRISDRLEGANSNKTIIVEAYEDAEEESPPVIPEGVAAPDPAEADDVERALEAMHGEAPSNQNHHVQEAEAIVEPNNHQEVIPVNIPVAVAHLQPAEENRVEIPMQVQPVVELPNHALIEEPLPAPLLEPLNLVPPMNEVHDRYRDRPVVGVVDNSLREEQRSIQVQNLRIDREVQEIGSSSEAVPAVRTRQSHFEQPTSSADVDSTVGDHLPDDGGVDSTSSERRSREAGPSSSSFLFERENLQRPDRNAMILNEATARQPNSPSGHFERGQDVNAMMNIINYGLQDEIQEPHSGMQ